VRERRSVREFSDKEKKKTKKTLDTTGVVRDGPLMAPRFFFDHRDSVTVYFTHCATCVVGIGLKFRGADGKPTQLLHKYARPELLALQEHRSSGISSTSPRPPRIGMFTEPFLR